LHDVGARGRGGDDIVLKRWAKRFSLCHFLRNDFRGEAFGGVLALGTDNLAGGYTGKRHAGDINASLFLAGASVPLEAVGAIAAGQNVAH
jgi:hypothetical protein